MVHATVFDSLVLSFILKSFQCVCVTTGRRFFREEAQCLASPRLASSPGMSIRLALLLCLLVGTFAKSPRLLDDDAVAENGAIEFIHIFLSGLGDLDSYSPSW